jgi:putative membrane protein
VAGARRRLVTNWRVTALRVPSNALALAFTAWVLSGIHITTQRPLLGYLVLGAVFGLLNAFIKPALQYLTLPLLLESFGLVVVIVDVLVFWLFEVIFPHVVKVDGFWWLLAGGALLGLVSFLFDTLLGLTPPIVDDRPSEEVGA